MAPLKRQKIEKLLHLFFSDGQKPICLPDGITLQKIDGYRREKKTTHGMKKL